MFDEGPGSVTVLVGPVDFRGGDVIEFCDQSDAGIAGCIDVSLTRTRRIELKLLARPIDVPVVIEDGQALTDFLDEGFDFDYHTKNYFDAYLVTAVAASPDAHVLVKKVKKRISAVENHLEMLENGWPEDKDSYPFIVYALYKRRLESLELELKWLKWLNLSVKKIILNYSVSTIYVGFSVRNIIKKR